MWIHPYDLGMVPMVPILPANLAPDPRVWTREHVRIFLRWMEDEYALPPFNISNFRLNGKGLLILRKSDLLEKAPNAGDILFNLIHLLVYEAENRCPAYPTYDWGITLNNVPHVPNSLWLPSMGAAQLMNNLTMFPTMSSIEGRFCPSPSHAEHKPQVKDEDTGEE